MSDGCAPEKKEKHWLERPVEPPPFGMLRCVDCGARFPNDRLDMLNQHSETFHVAKKWETQYTPYDSCVRYLLQILVDEGYGVSESGNKITVRKFKP